MPSVVKLLALCCHAQSLGPDAWGETTRNPETIANLSRHTQARAVSIDVVGTSTTTSNIPRAGAEIRLKAGKTRAAIDWHVGPA